MDGYGIAIFLFAGGLWLATERKHGLLLFIAGVGAGILIGAIWAVMLVNRLLP